MQAWLGGQVPRVLFVVVSTLLIYASTLIGIRLGERRALTQLNPFDFVVAVALGSIVARTATSRSPTYVEGLAHDARARPTRRPAGCVSTRPSPGPTGAAAMFELRVTNISDRPAALLFDTTQGGDVRLSTPDTVEVYHWAELRAFSLEPADVPVAPGEQVTFRLDEEPLPVAPGDYHVLAAVTGESRRGGQRREDGT